MTILARVLLFPVLLASLALVSHRADAAPPLCLDLDLSAVPMGTVCVTTRATEFKLIQRNSTAGQVSELWLDLSRGTRWELRSERWPIENYREAEASCASRGLRLPSRTQVLQAKRSGVAELFRKVYRQHWFWTSTRYRAGSSFYFITRPERHLGEPEEGDDFVAIHGAVAGPQALCMSP